MCVQIFIFKCCELNFFFFLHKYSFLSILSKNNVPTKLMLVLVLEIVFILLFFFWTVDVNSKLSNLLTDTSPKLLTPSSVVSSVSSSPSVETERKMVTSPSVAGDKNGTSSSVKDDLETPTLSEKSFDRVGDLSSETRKRGCSVVSESRSRSSSVNSVDSGSSFMMCADQLPEAQRDGQLSSQRFSTISSEDFDQELIVKPIKVKKKKKKKQGRSSRTFPAMLVVRACFMKESVFGRLRLYCVVLLK